MNIIYIISFLVLLFSNGTQAMDRQLLKRNRHSQPIQATLSLDHQSAVYGGQEEHNQLRKAIPTLSTTLKDPLVPVFIHVGDKTSLIHLPLKDLAYYSTGSHCNLNINGVLMDFTISDNPQSQTTFRDQIQQKEEQFRKRPRLYRHHNEQEFIDADIITKKIYLLRSISLANGAGFLNRSLMQYEHGKEGFNSIDESMHDEATRKHGPLFDYVRNRAIDFRNKKKFTYSLK